MASHETGNGLRRFDLDRFNQVYDRIIIGNHFCETPAYYQEHRGRYCKTIRYLSEIDMPRPARVFEIGGGQIVLLCKELYGDQGVLGDLSDEYADAVTDHGIEFVRYDLVHNDLPNRDDFDLVVLCEVFEHMSVPPYIVLEKIKQWIKPGGYLFLTTPNLYRLRNVLRLALGMRVFCHFYHPQPGQGIGHPIEYSVPHVRWQVEKAGYEPVYVQLDQLMNVGSTLKANVARKLCAPLLAIRPLWRDNIVALARKPG